MYLLRCTDAQARDFAVVGSSPEVLAKINDGHVISRPIGGTRPRGEKPQDDLYLEQELRADLKELGEHDILVELAQDDMKKVCDPATVELTEYLTVERYSHVMHLVRSEERRVWNVRVLTWVVNYIYTIERRARNIRE